MLPKHALGGILLIGGTALGAGMLALPIATAAFGFLPSVLLFSIAWFFMTSSALLLLEVNLSVAPGSNLSTLAFETLGKKGKIFCWITYLLLLYSLTSAYITGGGGWFSEHMMKWFHVPVSPAQAACSVSIVIALLVYGGETLVDYTNRILVLIKISGFVYLMSLLFSHLNPEQLTQSHTPLSFAPLPLLLTAFGFHIVIPTLTSYIGCSKKLRDVVLIGSLLPLICYILWEGFILGTLPFDGPNGLLSMAGTSQPLQSLAEALTPLTHNNLGVLARGFLIFAIATSFLGVTLSLFAFLQDALKIKKQARRFEITALTFLPPLFIVTFFPAGFLFALQFAGLFVALLLGLLPVLMAWKARYVLKLRGPYQVCGGKVHLLLTGAFFILVAFIECQHVFRTLYH